MTVDIIVIATVAFAAVAFAGYRIAHGGRRKDGAIAPAAEISMGSMTVKVRTVMMVLVSFVVLGSSLFVILSGQYGVDSERWAYGVAGSIVGFWLRPETA